MNGNARRPITIALRKKCTKLVLEASRKYDVPPVIITSHCKHARASQARREVMAVMIADYGMRRWQVAEAFGRDVRRVRKSVIGV